jgi:hypothetical protein
MAKTKTTTKTRSPYVLRGRRQSEQQSQTAPENREGTSLLTPLHNSRPPTPSNTGIWRYSDVVAARPASAPPEFDVTYAKIPSASGHVSAVEQEVADDLRRPEASSGRNLSESLSSSRSPPLMAILLREMHRHHPQRMTSRSGILLERMESLELGRGLALHLVRVVLLLIM